MKKEYMEKVMALLDEYGLGIDDLTPEEIKEITEEAKEREENPDIVILDGYFGDPANLENIRYRKMHTSLNPQGEGRGQ